MFIDDLTSMILECSSDIYIHMLLLLLRLIELLHEQESLKFASLVQNLMARHCALLMQPLCKSGDKKGNVKQKENKCTHVI